MELTNEKEDTAGENKSAEPSLSDTKNRRLNSPLAISILVILIIVTLIFFYIGSYYDIFLIRSLKTNKTQTILPSPSQGIASSPLVSNVQNITPTISINVSAACHNYTARIDGAGYTGFTAQFNGRKIQEYPQSQSDEPANAFTFQFNLPNVENGENILEIIPAKFNFPEPPKGARIECKIECSSIMETHAVGGKTYTISSTTWRGGKPGDPLRETFKAQLPYYSITLEQDELSRITNLLNDTFPAGAPVIFKPQDKFNNTAWLEKNLGKDSGDVWSNILLSSVAWYSEDSTVSKTAFDDMHSMRFIFPGYHKTDKQIILFYSSRTGKLADVEPIIFTASGEQIYAISILKMENGDLEIIGLHEDRVFKY